MLRDFVLLVYLCDSDAISTHIYVLCPMLGRPNNQQQTDRKTNFGLKNLRIE